MKKVYIVLIFLLCFSEIFPNIFKDKENPVIYLNRPQVEYFLKLGVKFDIPVARVVDNKDNNLEAKVSILDKDNNIVQLIDNTKEGKYTIEYSASDKSKNKADSISIVVNYIDDDEKPIIILEPNIKKYKFIGGETFKFPLAKVLDNKSKNLKAAVRIVNKNEEVVSEIMTDSNEKYTISYDVFDDVGNKADTVAITVAVKIPFTGFKKLEYVNGGMYEGYLEKDKKNGFGTYVFKNGEEYIGNWSNDKMNGFGVYTFKNGDLYEGNWLDNNMSGEGKYVFKNGKVLQGVWTKNKFISNKKG